LVWTCVCPSERSSSDMNKDFRNATVETMLSEIVNFCAQNYQ
jgi:hypothetical protein